MSEAASFASDADDADEGLQIDDSLPPLERLQRYLSSTLIIQRLHVVRSLGETAAAAGPADTERVIIPLLRDIQGDAEPVLRQALAEQIAEVARATPAEAYERVLLGELVRTARQLTVDSNPQVRQSACEALVALGPMLRAADLDAHLMAAVRALADDAADEEHRVEACQLLHALAPLLGGKLCRAALTAQLGRLARDPNSFRVRKAVAANMGNVAAAVAGEVGAVEEALELLALLSEDEIWGVRKAVAESLYCVAQHAPQPVRAARLPRLLQALAADSSRWVRAALYQQLGVVISTLGASDAVSPELLRLFTDMALDGNEARFGDSDVQVYCAFAFPAVLHTVGAERWDGDLGRAYFVLARDLQWKVRRSLAHSLHEVARMLGAARAEALLVPLFELFLKDLDEVRVGVLRHLAAFLAVLPAPRRAAYVAVLDELRTGDQAAWRFRRLAAKQLGALGALFDAALAQQHLVPLALHLCLDTVAAVRRAAHIHAPAFLAALPPAAAAQFMQGLAPLATAPYFVHRQAFAALAPAVSQRGEAEQAQLLPHLQRFVTDPVPNVRLALARALAALAPLPPALALLVPPLAADKDRDVRGALAAVGASITTPAPAIASAATPPATPSATPAAPVPVIAITITEPTEAPLTAYNSFSSDSSAVSPTASSSASPSPAASAPPTDEALRKGAEAPTP